MQIRSLFDPRTWTLTYVVWDEATRDAVVIDPVLDFDPPSGRVWEESVEKVAAVIAEESLNLRWVLETHAHADHLSGAMALKRAFDARIAIGQGIRQVQEVFYGVFHMDVPADGTPFDRLLADGDVIEVGGLKITALATPGHTPACTSFVVGDAVFTGDALFMPDQGTGRCDFPAGSAETLFHSIHDRLYALPPTTRVFVGHDYQPNGRPLAWESTIAAEMAENIHLKSDTPREAFVAWRQGRDRTLDAPRLLLPSLQVNIRAGELPPPEANGTRYLRLPLKLPEES